ncbi:hypothetical protein OHA25_08120 [Nonomuraea sp. NBC_00507]|uniref:hypothetical protein n=1 Tax=Nonomuraea sp. NBC_00507 TaxID=2976002 RepID=UPI002E19DFBB
MTANRIRLIAGIAAASLLALSPAVAAAPQPWTDAYTGVGQVNIGPDRKTIFLCDDATDTEEVAIRYEVSYDRLFRRIGFLKIGPRKGCIDDTLWLGTVTAAAFCHGIFLLPNGYNDCRELTKI